MAVTTKNDVFCYVMPCGSCTNRHFGVVFLRIMVRLVDTANVVPSSSILVNLMMDAIRSSENSVPTIATRRNIPDDVTLPVLFMFPSYSLRCN
jgi:hypothetical protein